MVLTALQIANDNKDKEKIGTVCAQENGRFVLWVLKILSTLIEFYYEYFGFHYCVFGSFMLNFQCRD